MTSAKHIHFIGIGGIGMSAIAKVMLEDGQNVTGCDLKPSSLVLHLAEKGARIWTGHDPVHLESAEAIVVTAAVPQDNPELSEARRRGLPILRRADMLGQLMDAKFGIAIAGTHGKTTTTSLVAHLLETAGLDPTVLVGGEMIDLGTNAKRGQGPYLVAEADEFDAAFLSLRPQIAVVTNIEAEHLDYYGTYQAVVAAFGRFLASVPPEGHLVLCGDDSGVQTLLAAEKDLRAKIITYGFEKGLSWQATNLEANAMGNYGFTAVADGAAFGSFQLAIPGRHNVLNALAAVAVGHLLGIAAATVETAIASFSGVRRRFELRGEVRGITVIDDYGHHPTEIRATLRAARERFGQRRILCVFQPHTYSRTKHLLQEFAACFDEADEVLIADIYASRERDTLGISAKDLVAALRHPHGHYAGSLAQATHLALDMLRSGDVLLAVGAGDIDSLSTEVLKRLTA